MEPLDPKIMKDWDKFLKFIREKHNLTDDWIPCYYSIRLYKEFETAKKKGV